ncbi:hypothetical protein AWC38_SpisGene2323 [Stylophora pistillata]|uniref:Uncharacterized protein n=1 Tax=Stylophora pistillata TaxID=50429 RepID=A0A2B4SSG0_STYPI|nr:hypothetical protein AWC38_SpisGene2323 [Stylophora pistillata]
MMKVSLLFLAALVVVLLLHTSHYSEASEISQVLKREIQELRDEIEKRRKRKPCGLTWHFGRCKGRGKRSYWDKRRGIADQGTSFSSFGSDDMDALFNDWINEE